MSNNRYDPVLTFSIGVSIFGILIVLLLALNPPITYEEFFWRKPLVGSVFSLICMLGIFAALFPKQCSQAFHFRRENMHFPSHQTNATSHHPDCERFSAHVIQVGARTLCAACTGLLLGAFVAFIGTVFYFFGGWQIEEVSFPIVLIGLVWVTFGFLQFKFRGFVRSILNALFVLGASLILVGIDELTESLIIDLFLVALIVFWILTRIQISQWDHWRICSGCESPCEVGEKKRK